jgi:hypothetical protein
MPVPNPFRLARLLNVSLRLCGMAGRAETAAVLETVIAIIVALLVMVVLEMPRHELCPASFAIAAAICEPALLGLAVKFQALGHRL